MKDKKKGKKRKEKKIIGMQGRDKERGIEHV